MVLGFTCDAQVIQGQQEARKVHRDGPSLRHADIFHCPSCSPSLVLTDACRAQRVQEPLPGMKMK